jgi:dihydrodipicolinate synthase/N-acetylneuraminate lyase
MRLFRVLMSLGGTRATKAAMDILGMPAGITRRPRLPLLDAGDRAKISAVLDEVGIRQIEGL